jgi:hypothetical protein
MQPDSTLLDNIPGMDYLVYALQRNVQLNLNKKTVKTGKLILFKRVHYCIQLTLQNSKMGNDSYEIPIPFSTEYYSDSGHMYFDYRIITLSRKDNINEKILTQYKEHVDLASAFYDRILEIIVLD